MVSRTDDRASSGSDGSIKKLVSTHDTEPLVSSGLKRLP
jgi:hypothetical protein